MKKSFDEILEYLNKRDDRGDYQIHPDLLYESIHVQLPKNIFLSVDVQLYRISFIFDKGHSQSMLEMEELIQQLQQAIKMGEDLEKFLQSP